MYIAQGFLIVATAYYLALVGLILYRTRLYRAGRSLALFLACIALWTTCIGMMQPQFGDAAGLWLARASFVATTILGGAWLWFCADFPVASPKFRRVALVLFTFGIPWLFLAWSPLLVERIVFREDWIDSVCGPLLLPYGFWALMTTAAGAWHMAVKRKQVYGIARMQVRYILVGIAGLILLSLLLNIVIPGIFRTTRYSLYGPLLASLFMATTITASILRHHLLDIKVVLRKALALLATIASLAAAFILLIPVMELLLTGLLRFPPRSGTFLCAFLLALGFQPASQAVQQWLDKRFTPTVIDGLRRQLQHACHLLASARNQRDIAEMLAAAAAAVETRGVAVLLPGHDGVLMQANTLGAWQGLPRKLPPEYGALGHHALQTDEVLIAEELVRESPRTQQLGQWLLDWEVAVAVPMVAGARLCGLLLLREKHSGEMYIDDELAYLRFLGKQAAIASDSIQHFDDVLVVNEYHERLLSIMQDGVIALDPQRKITTFNEAAQRILGLPAADALGKTLSSLGIFGEPLDPLADQPREVLMQTRTGTDVPVLLSVTPFTDSEDTRHSYLLVFRDLSAIYALNQAKLQAERFSSMGAMAASLAHEIKNPLVPIQTFAHLLPSRYDDEEFRREFSVTVVHEVERINWLVGQMLDLVRKPEMEREAINLSEIVQRLLDIIQPECEQQNIQLNFICMPHLPVVHGVPNQLYQAIMNVLVNAVEAMPDGGKLTVVLSAVGGQILCRVTDTGAGVPAEELPRIFEPLFTTKIGGHGMGLALTYQFVHLHDGEVRAESAPGTGLTVAIVLPITEMSPAIDAQTMRAVSSTEANDRAAKTGMMTSVAARSV